LVKEEKILILAMESQDNAQVANAIKDVLSACILTRGVKIEKFATFDIEYLFLNIRGKSVGEELEVMVTCPDDGETQVPATIRVDNIEVEFPEGHTTDIKLDDQYTVRMKYPSMEEFVKSNFTGEDVDVNETFNLISSCIDQIYSEEESWTSADCTEKELNEFIEQFNSKQFKEVEKFFETMPKLSHAIKVTNPKTNVENEVVLEGLANFFN
jgi:hypothetical protein